MPKKQPTKFKDKQVQLSIRKDLSAVPAFKPQISFTATSSNQLLTAILLENVHPDITIKLEEVSLKSRDAKIMNISQIDGSEVRSKCSFSLV